MTTRRYAIDEISPGMTVRESELQDIVDTYVVLDNAEIINTDSGSDIVGTIWFIGRQLDDTYAKMDRKGRRLGVVFNRSIDREGLAEYND